MMKALVFGEILYDVYEDFQNVAGAGFNFALHLSRMIDENEAVSMLSAVGDDELGAKALKLALKEKMNITCIQKAAQDTGKALVFLDDNKIPDYEIVEQVAYDNIIFDEKLEKALNVKYDIFYFNLLIQRFEHNAQLLEQIKTKIQARFKIFDMTLRKQYFTKEKLEKALEFSNVLKINEQELALIQSLFYTNAKQKELLKLIQKDFDIAYIFLSLGAKGACLKSPNNFFSQKASTNLNIVDTVGAGDVFCAALAYALVKNLAQKKILALAINAAELLISKKGANAYIDFQSLKNKYFKGG